MLRIERPRKVEHVADVMARVARSVDYPTFQRWLLREALERYERVGKEKKAEEARKTLRELGEHPDATVSMPGSMSDIKFRIAFQEANPELFEGETGIVTLPTLLRDTKVVDSVNVRRDMLGVKAGYEGICRFGMPLDQAGFQVYRAVGYNTRVATEEYLYYGASNGGRLAIISSPIATLVPLHSGNDGDYVTGWTFYGSKKVFGSHIQVKAGQGRAVTVEIEALTTCNGKGLQVTLVVDSYGKQPRSITMTRRAIPALIGDKPPFTVTFEYIGYLDLSVPEKQLLAIA